MENDNTPIHQGIKSVGVGKRGSKPLSSELVSAILDQLKSNDIAPVALGAFWGGLMIKGLTNEEKRLEEYFSAGTLMNPQRLIEALCTDISPDIKNICIHLLNKENLDYETSKYLGEFLFSKEKGDTARGLITSILRVRYTSIDEYAGILSSMQETINNFFQHSVEGEPIVQISEPFDGFNRSYFITPLIASAVQNLGFRAVSLVGRNSGPKFATNLLNIAQALDTSFLNTAEELNKPKPDYGWYIHQKNISPAIDAWVEHRHQIIKRPFLATLERFINPVGAKILITSAFHPNYVETMLSIAQTAGYAGIIVVQYGLEGGLTFPLRRPAKLFCSVRKQDKTYEQKKFTFDATDILRTKITVEEKFDNPSLKKNIQLIKKYLYNQKTENEWFDDHIRITQIGICKAIKWLQKNI
ncbi:hypothetical protein MNBD_GAMMA03-1421 [hydrothermal vent metagenome]|uniref:Anthranilate phosphoribosyltransferase like n=1 Tax=hydrothermal vent metagenome TaxID=652676 RepID=A0A3B0W5T9_9ZZZZ